MNLTILNDMTGCNGLSEFALVFNGSVGLEKGGLFGASHLAEHCMCDQVKAIEPRLLELGLSWNAYTSDNEVCFILNGLDRGVREMADEFAMLILDFRIPEEVFERERGIILAEYDMCASDQEKVAWMNFMRRKYGSYGPIGRRKDMESLTYSDFISFKDRNFSSPSYVKFTRAKGTERLLKSDLKRTVEFLRPKGEGEASRWAREMAFGDYPRLDAERGSSFGQQRILLACREFRSYELNGHSAYVYATILTDMLSNGMTSILKREVREKLGCVYSVSAALERVGQNRFLFVTSASANKGKVGLVERRLKEVFSDVISFIDAAAYRSSLTRIKARIEAEECVRHSCILDSDRLKCRADIASGAYDSRYREFVNFTLSLDLKGASYFIDTDFR